MIDDDNPLTVYLSGEIHTEWRDEVIDGCEEEDLPVEFTAPVTEHASSDACGTTILGDEKSSFWGDHKGAKINAIRTRLLLERADLVVVRFGDKYKQWTAAFEAGVAVSDGTPIITLHDESLDHALKEVDAAALAVARTTAQVVELLRYVTEGELTEAE